MAEGYALHRGHHSFNYTMTWLGRWAELRLLGVPVRCRAYRQPLKLIAWQWLDTINKQYKVLNYTSHSFGYQLL